MAMRLFKFEYTVTASAPSAVSALGSPAQVRASYISLLLAEDATQAQQALLTWRLRELGAGMTSAALTNVTYSDYYAATSGSLQEVTPGSSQRPLLIGTDSPQELYVAAR